MTTETVTLPGGAASHLKYFRAEVLDGTPWLEQSYQLRYQVYCVERKFIDAARYPSGSETDEFDSAAVHVGAVDRHQQLAGTARLVSAGTLGFPLSGRCTLYDFERAKQRDETSVEVSRMSVSRTYRRRPGDAQEGFTIPAAEQPYSGSERRRVDGEVFLTVMKAVYQASKRMGATHWLAATEKSLQRILARYGFPFRQIGPESDYFGMVAPYRMCLAEFDDVIVSGAFPVLDDFVLGLEPALLPRRRDDLDAVARTPVPAAITRDAMLPTGAL